MEMISEMDKKWISCPLTFYHRCSYFKVVISSGLLFSFLPNILCIKNEGVLYNIRPVNVKQYSVPYRSHYGLGYLNSNYPFKQKDPVYRQQPVVHGDDIFQIEASDAIDDIKYSQLDIGYQEKVPSSIFSKHQLLQTSAQNPSPPKFQEQVFPSLHSLEKNSLKLLNSMRDVRYLDSAGNEGASSGISGEEFRFENKNSENVAQAISDNTETTDIYLGKKNNFTDASENLDLVSSEAVLRYEVPSESNDSSSRNSVKKIIDIVRDVPSHNYSDFTSSTSLSPQTSNGYTTPNPIYLNTHLYIDYINITNLTDNVVSSSIVPSITDEENVTNSLPSIDIEKKLSSGTVAGIVIAVLVSVTLLSSAVIYLLYRKFNGKCTSVVESKFNTDNCGYLDDSLRSSIYLNNHIELPKESSEEMTSLDNDSFLNSLETMTIQNYWADNSKNTKV